MSHEATQELLPLYALSALDEAERALVREHLASGCESCAAELQMHQETVVELAFAAPPVAPPPELRDRIVYAATHPANANHVGVAQTWRDWADSKSGTAGMTLVRADEGRWESVMAGVAVKRLSFDAERQIATMLIRMLPGTCYPSHRHAQAEECLVIDGDLHVGDELVMHAGDFQRAERDSVHVPQWTVDGCLLLVTSSLEDELLA